MAILGESGAGKTTLLSCLAGLDIPSSGQIICLGHNLSSMDEDERAAVRRDNVGFVFQSFHLIDSLTAIENVMLPLELQGKPAYELAKKWCERIGLLDRLHHTPAQLSGGEQQRVAIARAFINEPKILFADEPTGNLDSKTSQSVEDCLFDFNTNNQTTLIIVTHSQQLANRCQRIIHLQDGRVQ